MYHLNIFRFFTSMEDHLLRLKEAEEIDKLWKVSGLLILASMFIYGWMGYLGIGSDLILKETIPFSPAKYESSKFWFFIGRVAYGAIFAVLVIFVPALVFKWLTNIPFQKLMVMQLIVLSIVLMERITWIPLVIFGGLDWYVSPFSFGIIASLFTAKTWVISFFGIISIFQLWVIWFQVKFIGSFLEGNKILIPVSVFILNVIVWWMATLMTIVSPQLLGRWFG